MQPRIKTAEAVRALLKQHVDVNAPEADGTTALHWAAHFGDLDLVEALLKEGANVSALNRYGATPLSEAVRIGERRADREVAESWRGPEHLYYRTGRDRADEGIA